MALEVFIVEVGDVLVFRCTGRVSFGPEVDRLEQELSSHEAKSKKFILHLGDVSFLDSSAMGLIVRVHSRLVAAGGDLKLCNAGERVSKTLNLLGMGRSVEIYAHELDAINAFYHEREDQQTEHAGPVVVCIDSSQNILAYLGKLLASAGFTPKTLSNAFDARSVIKTTRPRLVILGPHVPGGNTANFQETLHGIPTLALPEDFHVTEAAEAGEKLLAVVKAKAAGK